MRARAPIIFLLLSLGALARPPTRPSPEDRMLDLGVGGVDSEVQGARYLARIHGSLGNRLNPEPLSLERTVLEDMAQRHLQRIENAEGAHP